MGLFKITEVPVLDFNEVTGVNDEYLNKSSATVRHLFNNTRLCIYMCLQKVLFDNGSDIKQYFTTLLKDFDIKHVRTKIKTHKLTLQWSG